MKQVGLFHCCAHTVFAPHHRPAGQLKLGQLLFIVHLLVPILYV